MARVELQDAKLYARVDYDDDDSMIQLMLDAVVDEMQELIPTFDAEAPTNRQRLLILAYVKELYDGRGNTTVSQDKLRYAVQSMLLKEMLR